MTLLISDDFSDFRHSSSTDRRRKSHSIGQNMCVLRCTSISLLTIFFLYTGKTLMNSHVLVSDQNIVLHSPHPFSLHQVSMQESNTTCIISCFRTVFWDVLLEHLLKSRRECEIFAALCIATSKFDYSRRNIDGGLMSYSMPQPR